MKEKPALVYWDIHFDNILLKNKKIAGLLDFEGVDIMSIDYVLSHVRRLQNYPEIYVSEDFEKKIKKEDYSHLLKWFKEFYPELFRFKNLNRRLDLYDLEYDLKLLLDYPNSKKVKERLNRLIVNAFG